MQCRCSSLLVWLNLKISTLRFLCEPLSYLLCVLGLKEVHTLAQSTLPFAVARWVCPLSVPHLFLKEGAGRRLQILGAHCHSRVEAFLQRTRLSILLRVEKCGFLTHIWRVGSAPRGVHRQDRTQPQACQSSWSLGYVLKLLVGFLGLSYTGPGVELISLCGTLPTWDILWFDDIRGLGQYHLSGLQRRAPAATQKVWVFHPLLIS